MPIAQIGGFEGDGYYGTLIRNPIAEVEPTGQRAWSYTATADNRTATTTKPSPALLQKHSLGGCIIDMPPPSNIHRRG